jgi:hypothetical protein
MFTTACWRTGHLRYACCGRWLLGESLGDPRSGLAEIVRWDCRGPMPGYHREGGFTANLGESADITLDYWFE